MFSSTDQSNYRPIIIIIISVIVISAIIVVALIAVVLSRSSLFTSATFPIICCWLATEFKRNFHLDIESTAARSD